ncbi:MAG: hypothetical protein ACYTGR_11720 [Planctomycetota bacterium]|jgi:hypothetical protein
MDRPGNQDRDRLKEVHATDLTESRVNEEFVDWLKTKGPTWLLFVLVAVTGYLGIIRFKQHGVAKENAAWFALNEAISTQSLPSSKEDVAAEHGSVRGITELALQSAGDQLLASVQRGQSINVTPGDTTTTPADLTDEERSKNLDRADSFFARIVDRDDSSLGMTLHTVKALNGRAAVAEAKGDKDAARTYYESAAARAEAYYPTLAAQARGRVDTLDAVQPITLPDAPAPVTTPQTFTTGSIMPALEDLLLPTESDDEE